MGNRELKFRAWNEAQNRVTDPFEIGSVLANVYGGGLLMQFTGLLDKNGIEIYEGDIIRSTFNPKLIHIVKWVDGEGGFGCENPDLVEFTRTSAGITQEWVTSCEKEIAGNVYENPELIQSQAATAQT